MLIRLLLRLLSDKSYKMIKNDVIQEWLMSLSSSDSGYRGYYTIRKRAILGLLSIGLEQKEYWTNLGRLAELKHLNQLSMDLIKKQTTKKKERKKPKKK